MHAHLVFIRDHWARLFRSELPGAVLADVKKVLETLNAGHYSSRTPITVFRSGTDSIERLVGAIDQSGKMWKEVDALKAVMGMPCGDAEQNKKDSPQLVVVAETDLGSACHNDSGDKVATSTGGNETCKMLVKRANQHIVFLMPSGSLKLKVQTILTQILD